MLAQNKCIYATVGPLVSAWGHIKINAHMFNLHRFIHIHTYRHVYVYVRQYTCVCTCWMLPPIGDSSKQTHVTRIACNAHRRSGQSTHWRCCGSWRPQAWNTWRIAGACQSISWCVLQLLPTSAISTWTPTATTRGRGQKEHPQQTAKRTAATTTATYNGNLSSGSNRSTNNERQQTT